MSMKQPEVFQQGISPLKNTVEKASSFMQRKKKQLCNTNIGLEELVVSYKGGEGTNRNEATSCKWAKTWVRSTTFSA